MIVSKNAIQKLQLFKKKSKFDIETKAPFYQGLGNPKLKSSLTLLLNNVADEFIFTIKNAPTEIKFQNNIKSRLSMFDTLYLDLDTEDKEKICCYFEEMMDCVGLESSDGQLNKWMYGFDPTKKN